MKFKIFPATIGIGTPLLDAWKNAPQGLSTIHMPLRGRMQCKTSKGIVEMTPGNIYFMANRISLQFDLDPNAEYEHLFMNFRALPPLLIHEMLCINAEDDPYLFHLVKAIEALVHRQMEETGQNKVRGTSNPFWQQTRPVMELLVQHFRQHYGITTVENTKLVKAIAFIEDHFREPLQNKDIAAELHIDPRYLIRLFRSKMDISPHGYLTQCRIDHAMSLLRDNVPVAVVAEMCGFQSENAFRIAFKKNMGVPPSHFLKGILP